MDWYGRAWFWLLLALVAAGATAKIINEENGRAVMHVEHAALPTGSWQCKWEPLP